MSNYKVPIFPERSLLKFYIDAKLENPTLKHDVIPFIGGIKKIITLKVYIINYLPNSLYFLIFILWFSLFDF